MRILFLSPTLGIGGSETLTFRYATHMKARGHETAVAYAWVDEQAARLEAAGIRCVRVSPQPLTGRTLPEWRRALRRLVSEYEPTVIHAQSVTSAIAARLGAPRVPLLVTLHGLELARNERIAAPLLRLTGGTLTAVSQRAADSIGRYRPSPHIEVLPGGLDIADVEAGAEGPAPPAPGHPHFCCVARQEPVKGIDVLVRAFALASDRLPEAGLTLVGGGTTLEANQALARELGIADRLRFTGRLPNALSYIRAADVGVLPSRREGLPIVALETLALGRPLIATAVGGTPTVVRDGETGWLVPPEDPRRLADAIVEAGANLDEAARRGRLGRRLIEEEFDPERLYDRLESLLLCLTGESRHADTTVPPIKPRPWYLAARGYQRARLMTAHGDRSVDWEGVRILGYHRVSDDGDVLATPPATFRLHMEVLAESGVEVLPLEAAMDLLASPVRGRHACITFDDAFADVAVHAAPILAERGFPATVFVPTSILDGRAPYSWYGDAPPALTWDDLRAMVASGVWSAQAHSRTHPRLSVLSRKEAMSEIAGSKSDLEERLGRPVTSFAYPAGLYSPRDVELVLAAGFRAGLTCRAGVNPGGAPMGELRRTMIAWGDGEAAFRAKLGGALDRPAPVAEWLWRRRTRAGSRQVTR
jgi:glycosyltransferase involved in cell wall biosynthesis/peptidoglycan/xylan/chitin deacetylase (PgdA/CDA1 family)